MSKTPASNDQMESCSIYNSNLLYVHVSIHFGIFIVYQKCSFSGSHSFCGIFCSSNNIIQVFLCVFPLSCLKMGEGLDSNQIIFAQICI